MKTASVYGILWSRARQNAFEIFDPLAIWKAPLRVESFRFDCLNVPSLLLERQA